jgi:hypothetical protein
MRWLFGLLPAASLAAGCGHPGPELPDRGADGGAARLSSHAGLSSTAAAPANKHMGGAAPVSGERLARPLAVMVENHPAARPQSGLAQADVVYEVLAEGGITRFLALFRTDSARTVGPIRSARPYFIDLMEAFDPVYVHCGQSWEAEKVLSQRVVAEINELHDRRPFWRDKHRRPPHNLYASTASLAREADRLGLLSPPNPWPLKQSDSPLVGKPALSIDLAYHDGLRYDVHYQYDSGSRRYLRSVNGRPHVDAVTGQQLRADTVIMEEAATRSLGGKYGELDIDVIGSGRCWLARDGCWVAGYWRKDAAETATYYTARDGSPLYAAPGQTWIQIFPEGDRPRIAAR